jgi:hypothetical protein
MEVAAGAQSPAPWSQETAVSDEALPGSLHWSLTSLQHALLGSGDIMDEEPDRLQVQLFLVLFGPANLIRLGSFSTPK